MEYRSSSTLCCCILLISSLTTATGLKTSVTCSRNKTEKRFSKLFSISILLNKTVTALIDEDSHAKKVELSSVPISNVSGLLAGDTAYLSAVMDIDCHMVDTLQCEMFGIPLDMNGYAKEVKAANVTFEASVTKINSSIDPKKEWFVTGDTVRISCSADVGYPDEKWYLVVNQEPDNATSSQEPENAMSGQELMISTFTRSACIYNTTASIDFRVKNSGQIQLRCNYGSTEVGKFVITVLDFHECLSYHLLVSSMVLVYCPFIIMPTLWCSCNAYAKTWRNPEKKLYKLLRSVLSFTDGILFTVWWIWAYYKYGESKVITGYLTFAVIEVVFIFGYAIYRCLFMYLEKKGNWYGTNRAYHSRVTTSHGAVVNPIICWLMIRVPYHLTCNAVEILFWIIAFGSTMFFAFVSHQREHDDWTKKAQ